MFLAQLNEEQLDLYIDLAIHGARSNGDLDLKQKAMLEVYSKYIGRDIIADGFKAKRENISDILSEMEKKCNIVELKIIFIEIVVLIMLDDRYDVHEQKFIQEIQEWFNITDEQVGKIFRGVSHLVDGLGYLEDAVLGDEFEYEDFE